MFHQAYDTYFGMGLKYIDPYETYSNSSCGCFYLFCKYMSTDMCSHKACQASKVPTSKQRDVPKTVQQPPNLELCENMSSAKVSSQNIQQGSLLCPGLLKYHLTQSRASYGYFLGNHVLYEKIAIVLFAGQNIS